jgi:four helix bundle protein
MAQAAADMLQERFVSFAVRIIELVTHLPKTTTGRHVGGQILRSGTSPAQRLSAAK